MTVLAVSSVQEFSVWIKKCGSILKQMCPLLFEYFVQAQSPRILFQRLQFRELPLWKRLLARMAVDRTPRDHPRAQERTRNSKDQRTNSCRCGALLQSDTESHMHEAFRIVFHCDCRAFVDVFNRLLFQRAIFFWIEVRGTLDANFQYIMKKDIFQSPQEFRR